MENCSKGGVGAYKPLFQDPPPRPRGGGGGLFCQATLGADGLHGTNMGTKNQKKKKTKKKHYAFLESARRDGSEKWSFAPFSMNK